MPRQHTHERMDPTGPTTASTDPSFRLVARPDEIAHLVCCRDASWKVAFCGAEGDEINPAAEVICSMCVAEARAMRPQLDQDDEPTCPVDGNPCPEEFEIDMRIAREADR
jgi:hypothetical protein